MPTFSRTLLVELNLAGVWTDVTQWVRQVEPVTITRGLPNEGGALTPASCSFTLDDRDGRFTPRNPASPYYGQLRRNTPVRVAVDGQRRFVGEIAGLAPAWDPSHRRRTVAVTAGGILRRLRQGSSPVTSAPRTWYPSSDVGLVAYWPLEDGRLATYGEPLVGRRRVELAAFNRASFPKHFGQGDLGPWLPPGVAMLGIDDLYADVDYQLRTTGQAFLGLWCVDHVRAGSVSTDTLLLVFTSATLSGVGAQWTVRFRRATADFQVTVPGGAVTTTATAVPLWDGNAHHVRLVTAQSGGNVDWFVDLDGTLAASGTVAALTNFPPSFVNIQDLADHPNEDFAVGHLAVYINSRPLADFADPALGWPGETAGRRLERLCAENGIAFTAIGDLDDTMPMGPQPPGTLLALLQDCVEADLGLLYEDRTDGGLTYRTRVSLYNQAPALTLDYAGQQVAPPFEPVDDDQRTRNAWTVKRLAGGDTTLERADGPLQVADPPTGVGRYDASVTVNVASNDELTGNAAWRLALGTVDQARYPKIRIDLAAAAIDAATDADVLDLEPGDRVVITDTTAAKLHADVDQLALGYTEIIRDTFGHAIVLNTAPAEPYAVGVLDTGHLDSDSSTLASSATSTATSLSVASGAGTLWSTDAADYPVPITIGGEELNLTAVSGASSPQTFTVTRSINGVSKSHPAGAPVTLSRSAAIALGL